MACFSNCDVHRSHIGVVYRQILIQEVLRGACNSAFLTSLLGNPAGESTHFFQQGITGACPLVCPQERKGGVFLLGGFEACPEVVKCTNLIKCFIFLNQP